MEVRLTLVMARVRRYWLREYTRVQIAHKADRFWSWAYRWHIAVRLNKVMTSSIMQAKKGTGDSHLQRQRRAAAQDSAVERYCAPRLPATASGE
jgi:hypothetical protein